MRKRIKTEKGHRPIGGESEGRQTDRQRNNRGNWEEIQLQRLSVIVLLYEMLFYAAR